MRTLLLYLLCQTALASPLTAKSGDAIFVMARVRGCGADPLLVDRATVGDDGKISLLARYSIDARGLSAEQIQAQLSQKVLHDLGRKLASLQILLLSLPRDQALDATMSAEVEDFRKGLYCQKYYRLTPSPEQRNPTPLWSPDEMPVD